ncbi:MAG: mycofactocin biosynthesis peptidyl-dipeptidase MftE [Streptosporangiaceae bacterium]
MRLADLTSREAETLGDALLAIPVGSTEQHGPHLPLDTDTRVAAALAEALAAERDDVVVGPSLAYGASGEHETFAGTASIGREALETLVVELVRSASRTFRRVLLVNWHGGNADPVGRAVRRLRAERREVLSWWPRHGGGDAHAGRTETALMLALASDDVRLDRAEAGNAAPLAELIEVIRAASVRAVSPNGVLGDPAGATAAEGRVLFDRLADDLVAAVAAWARGLESPHP